MMLARRLFAYCLLFQTADVLGSGGWSTGRAGHGNGNPAETVAYETTVTTEMNYYMSEDSSHDTSEDSKSEKKRSNHAEYEYVSAGNPKSGKKGGYYTHAPTHMAVPPHGKGSKNGGHRTHSPTQAAAGKGYGKGKGGSSSSETSSSETSSSEKKSSKKGKGASGKGSKKGGNYPGYTPHPTPAHAPSGSGDYPSTRPPSPITAPTPGVRPTLAPAYSPSITASPTDEGSVAFDLEPFSLFYETETKRQALRNELAQVTDVTRLYLEDFMFEEFSGSSFTFLDDFVTRMITSTYIMGDDVPYVVDYSSTARFNPFSTVFPTEAQLQEALIIAFSGENMAEYESRLVGLPENNVFHGASVFFGEPVVRVSKRSSNNAASIAAAAVAATLLAAGAVLYKRRMGGEFFQEKDLNKDKGDATVAGETFAGETYDGSGSVSAASTDHLNRYRHDDDDYDDDEEGTKGHSLLGTIEETEDDNSVRPTWGANPSYDDEDDVQTLQNTMDDRSMVSEGADTRVLRRAATEGSSVTASTSGSGVPAAQSFDEMALQGLAHRVKSQEADGDDNSSHESDADEDAHFDSKDLTQDSKPEIASLLSHDSMDEHSIARTVSSSSSSKNSRRPKTVEEIEAMLTADNDDYDEESQTFSSISRSFGNDNSTSATSQRPRTVEEIESLLSAGLDDDYSECTELD